MSGELETFPALRDAITAAIIDAGPDGKVIVCRFPCVEDVCDGRSDMDRCPNCIRLDASGGVDVQRVVQQVLGGH